MVASIKKSENFFLKLRPLHRILVSLILAMLTLVFIRHTQLDTLSMLIILWDVFALSFVAISWIVFFKRSVTQIRQKAKEDDGSKVFVSVIVLLACFASMLAVALLILSAGSSAGSEAVSFSASIAGMLLSWIMVHTTFSFHYAEMYYADEPEDGSEFKKGLNFPNESDEPDYLDFAYFSFVLGMTFQVSDIEISSPKIRRLALVHSLLSFGLNTFVVALTINIVAGLRK